jgi:hypothetical protein
MYPQKSGYLLSNPFISKNFYVKTHCANLSVHVTCSSRLLRCLHKDLKKGKGCGNTEENGEFSCQLILKGNGTDMVEKVELLDGTIEGLGIHKFSTFDRG